LLAGWNNQKGECCGNWTSDGKYFVFQAMRDGVVNLWATREKGDFWRKVSREPVQLTVGQMTAEAPLPSKDGRKLFFIGASRRSELVRYDIKTHAFTPYLPGLSAEGVAFSPDGKKIVYVTYPDGVLWQSEADGSERRQLSFPPTEVGLPSWSPDGAQIAFAARQPGKTWQLFVVTAQGGDPEQLTFGDSDSLDASWSPDGNSLAFGGYDFAVMRSKGNAVHILSLKTRQVTAVPDSAGLYSPRWSPDGRYLVAMTVDFKKLVLYDFRTQKWEDLSDVPHSYPNWSHDGKCIYFNNAFEKDLPVYRICLNDRKLERIANLSSVGHLAEGQFGWWTGLSPDDGILAARDISIEEIYALNLKFP
jgi:Tol biopolymer transport system component